MKKDNLQVIFSKRLNEIMKYSQLSYADLARKLNISKATMSMYKNEKAIPSLETFSKLCDILDVSADYILGKKEY